MADHPRAGRSGHRLATIATATMLVLAAPVAAPGSAGAQSGHAATQSVSWKR